jgi:hypothetical protein
MYALDTLLNNIADESKQAELLERLDIVAHKIKFMDRVNLLVINTDGEPSLDLSEITTKAGARLTTDPLGAHYILVFQKDKQLNDLLAVAPNILNAEWPASKSRVSLLADSYDGNQAEDLVDMVEDIAEILHPGQFIFGFEGDKWLRFNS